MIASPSIGIVLMDREEVKLIGVFRAIGKSRSIHAGHPALAPRVLTAEDRPRKWRRVDIDVACVDARDCSLASGGVS